MAVPGQVERPELLVTQEFSFRSEGNKIPAYLARPRESRRYPGVILLHDIFGVSDHARDVARRFANVGFVSLVPDCFARIDLDADETKVRSRAGQLEDRLTVRDVESALGCCEAYLIVLAKSELWGFAWEDGQRCCSHVAATRWTRPSTAGAAGSARIRRPTPQHPMPIVDLVKNLKRPVYAVFGADDENPSQAHAAEMRVRLEREGKLGLVTMETFANAGHAFFADARPERYREKAAFELWPKMVSFFKTHLA